MHIYLRTDRLTLRRFTADDVDDLVALDADPEVMRYLTDGKATPREEIAYELGRILRMYERFPNLGRWAALDEDGGFLGWFGMRPPRGSNGIEVELAYRLRRAVWGRGLATEGTRALIGKAFGSLGVRRVYAETMAVNTASRRVMEKAGLQYVSTFRFDDDVPGREFGEVRYELLREEWAAPAGRGRPR